MKKYFAILRRVLRVSIFQFPALYMWPAQLAGRSVLDKNTSLIIEGFPRSGNSFVESAIRFSQPPETIRLAHHTHAPASVIKASRIGTPCLVLLRTPDEACRSLAMHHPELFFPRLLYWEYAKFYEAIEGVRRGLVLARFETAVSDFGRVIEAINVRFDTALAPFNQTVEAEQKIFALVNELSRERGTVFAGHEPYSLSVSDAERSAREQNKEILAAKYFGEANTSTGRRRALRVFGRLHEIADV